jgi:hypothetical protein
MPKEVTLTPFRVNPKAVHEFIIMPQFGDTISSETGDVLVPSNEEGDWQIVDNVAWRVPIIELLGNQNILKRRDATCKLIYSPVGKLGARYIFTEPLYAASEDCVDEFYQGCFRDYEQGNFDMFFEQVMPLMEKGVGADIYSNKYFGDVTREADVTDTWSWNKFDGIFTQLNKYIADGTVPAAQTFAIAPADATGGTVTPQEAHDYLEQAYMSQGFLMKTLDKMNKAFYVDYNIYDAYWDWLVLAGISTIAERQSGPGSINFRGIEVRPKYWDAILAALNGGVEGHIVCLTIKGNWLYATDSSYGGGPRRNEGIRIWYSMDQNIWMRQIHLKAGTEWANPQYVVLGITDM